MVAVNKMDLLDETARKQVLLALLGGGGGGALHAGAGVWSCKAQQSSLLWVLTHAGMRARVSLVNKGGPAGRPCAQAGACTLPRVEESCLG